MPSNSAFLRVSVSVALGASLLTGCVSKFDFAEVPITAQQELRTLELDSQSKEFIPYVNIPLVIDNSASMEDEQLLLARNSRSLANAVRGKNVRFSIVTSSALDGANAHEKATHSPVTVFEWTGLAGATQLSPLAPEVRDAAQFPAYEKRISHQLNPSLSGAPIEFRHDMTDDEFAERREQLYDAIVGVGTDGSDDEAGLCAIARTLAETNGPNKIFSPGDKAAFLVISDANDFSRSDACTKDVLKQKYRFMSATQPPVVRDVEDAVNPDRYAYRADFKSPDAFRVDYSYESETQFNVRSNYQLFRVFAKYTDPQYRVVAHSIRPEFRVVSQFQKFEPRINYRFQYASTCPGRDSSTVPCEKQDEVSNLAFSLEQLGGDALPGNGNCSGKVLAFVQARLQAGHSLQSCSFATNSQVQTANALFEPHTYGNPSNQGNTCNGALIDLAKGMVPAGWNYVACGYQYTSNERQSAESPFLASAHGITSTVTADQACNASLEDLAKTLVAPGYQYSGCHYFYRENAATTAASVFNPADYGNPPSVSGSGTCNGPLAHLAGTLIPAGKTFAGCIYETALTTAWMRFDPAQYGQPARGSGELACNPALESYARSLAPLGSHFVDCKYTANVQVASGSLPLQADPGVSSGSSCLGNAGLLAKVQSAVSGKAILTCTAQKTAGSIVAACAHSDDRNLAANLCQNQSFTANGETFANLEIYFRSHPGECSGAVNSASLYQGCISRTGYRKETTQPPAYDSYVTDGSAQKVSVIASLLSSASANTQSSASFQTAIQSRASELFGDKGYFISAILAHSQVGNCTPSPDSAGIGGEKYLNLANSRPPELRSLQPICADSYAPALEGISEFILRSALTSYRAPIAEDERILDVKIRRGSETITLNFPTDYTISGPTIDFTLDTVKPGDMLILSVARMVYRQGDKVVAAPEVTGL